MKDDDREQDQQPEARDSRADVRRLERVRSVQTEQRRRADREPTVWDEV